MTPPLRGVAGPCASAGRRAHKALVAALPRRTEDKPARYAQPVGSRRTGAATLVACALWTACGGAAVAASAAPEPPLDTLVLPKPVGEIPLVAPEVVTPERRRRTFVPGPVRDDERIDVAVGPDGAPAAVVVTQRLELTGTGDFAVRERGPALRVTALEGTTAPIIQRGTVVWQGFVPGRRVLAARIELDPDREALLLPLRVELELSGAGDVAIGPGASIPGPGRLVVRLVNQTSRPEAVPSGVGRADEVGAALDLLRGHAIARADTPPPAAGRDLPASVPAADIGTRTVAVTAPLRVTGAVRVRDVEGVTVTGPGTTPTARRDGATLAGVLHGSAEFTLDVPTAGTLELDLSVVPALDPRRLVPPARAPTWRAWAATDPAPAARRAATDLLVEAAAASARADEVAPYLGHAGPGPTSTRFRYRIAPAPRVVRAPTPLRPRPLPIALTATALGAVCTAAVAVWRRL